MARECRIFSCQARNGKMPSFSLSWLLLQPSLAQDSSADRRDRCQSTAAVFSQPLCCQAFCFQAQAFVGSTRVSMGQAPRQTEQCTHPEHSLQPGPDIGPKGLTLGQGVARLAALMCQLVLPITQHC